MPFRIEADDAARRIVDGIETKKPEIHFPRRLSLLFQTADVASEPIIHPSVREDGD